MASKSFMASASKGKEDGSFFPARRILDTLTNLG
jgi:hypothetical protein